MEDPGADTQRDVEVVGGARAGLHLPDHRSDETGARQDGIQGVEPGESIRFGVSGARAVGEGEVESIEEQGTPGLVGVQSFGGLDVRKILMVGQYEEGVFSSLKPVSPLLQGQHNSQQFSVPHGVVSFGGRQSA